MRSQDLSLLVIFDAIMIEGSITRAAERLNLTQPAVSNAVGRMRAIWKDDLFTKDGRNIRPTLFAQNLWNQVRQPLKEIDDAINPKRFEASTSRRVFTIAATDLMIDMVWAELRQRIEDLLALITLAEVSLDDNAICIGQFAVDQRTDH